MKHLLLSRTMPAFARFTVWTSPRKASLLSLAKKPKPSSLAAWRSREREANGSYMPQAGSRPMVLALSGLRSSQFGFPRPVSVGALDLAACKLRRAPQSMLCKHARRKSRVHQPALCHAASIPGFTKLFPEAKSLSCCMRANSSTKFIR
jgi:hypothetical protein